MKRLHWRRRRCRDFLSTGRLRLKLFPALRLVAELTVGLEVGFGLVAGLILGLDRELSCEHSSTRARFDLLKQVRNLSCLLNFWLSMDMPSARLLPLSLLVPPLKRSSDAAAALPGEGSASD